MNHLSASLSELFGKLDLLPHLRALEHFFSRTQSIALQGDQERHFRYIEALDSLEFKAPPKSVVFEGSINHLKKQGVLRFEDIFEIIKIVRYFRNLRNHDFSGLIGEWMETIHIPEPFNEIDEFFDESGVFIESRDEELHRISMRIKGIKTEINESMKRLLHTQKLHPYLVDTQIHYINDEESLLVRGGFNHVLKGSIIGRTGAGFFYVAPDSILRSKEQLRYVNKSVTRHCTPMRKSSAQNSLLLSLLSVLSTVNSSGLTIIKHVFCSLVHTTMQSLNLKTIQR